MAGEGEMAYASNRVAYVRFFKYCFLVLALILTTKGVLDCYSYYVARRGLDTELESKKISSLEYVKVMANRERALAYITLETRCAERTQLAFFRFYEADLARNVSAAYAAFFALKDELVVDIQKNGNGIVDVDSAVKKIGQATFSIFSFETGLTPVQGMTRDDPKFRQLQDHLQTYRKKSEEIADKYALELKEAIKKAEERQALLKLPELEKRLGRIAAARYSNRQKFGDFEELIARYNTWTSALSGNNASDYLVSDELVFEFSDRNKHQLADIECEKFRDFIAAATGKSVDTKGHDDDAWSDLSYTQKLGRLQSIYNSRLLSFFDIPPVAQTLLVTLLLGALGALTLNVLRLSKIGFWKQFDDPAWGEIIVSPLLGALAAFGIFLIGSAGLLLTGDIRAGQSSVAPLSASFIGILGFVSGLLYDQAFGRVRQVGSRLFAPDTDDTVAAASPEDRELADILKDAGASLVGAVLLKYGIGSRLAQETEFTFFVPSDDAVGQMQVKTWRGIGDSKVRGRFEKWFCRHYAQKKFTSASLIKDGQPAVPEIEVADGSKLSVEVANGKVTINKLEIAKADLEWKNGVIHVLAGEV